MLTFAIPGMDKFKVFHRTWWRLNPDWPNGLEPAPGTKRFITWAYTEEEARAICREWARYHAPGRLSDKAEYEATR